MAVNLLFSNRVPSLQVDSGLPERGRLRIATRRTERAPATLRIRRPTWLDAGRLAVRREGVPEPHLLTDHWLTDHWLIVPTAGPATVEITIPVPRRSGTEWGRSPAVPCGLGGRPGGGHGSEGGVRADVSERRGAGPPDGRPVSRRTPDTGHRTPAAVLICAAIRESP